MTPLFVLDFDRELLDELLDETELVRELRLASIALSCWEEFNFFFKLFILLLFVLLLVWLTTGGGGVWDMNWGEILVSDSAISSTKLSGKTPASPVSIDSPRHQPSSSKFLSSM